MSHVAIYIDLATCIIFLPLMIFVFPVERWWWVQPAFFISFMCWLYATYFLYKYYIVPHFFSSKRHRTYAITAIIVSLAVTFLFSSYNFTSPLYHLRQQQFDSIPYPIWGVRMNQQAVWIHYIIVVMFCFILGMLDEAYRQRLAREEVEYERNKAELALYKAQINPHFLFNTLNTIYGLLIIHSDKTEITLERFINLTRYMYNNANHDYISLTEEIDYISQYIDLQKLRLNEYADIQFNYHIEDTTVLIPPMILITFVENAFKYGISSNEPCFIHIDLRQSGDNISFSVNNSVFKRDNRNSKQMGLENCRKRLSLLYPGRHTLEYGKTKDSRFILRLEIRAGNDRRGE